MDFSTTATLLMKLSCKDEKFVWSEDCENSFQELKKRLTYAPILTLPSGIGGLVIYSEASLRSLGCILMQQGKVVTYVSQ